MNSFALVLSVVIGVYVSMTKVPPWNYLAVGIALTSFLFLLPFDKKNASTEKLRQVLLHPLSVFFLLTVTACVLFPEVFSQDLFGHWDHSVHFEKTRRLERLIAERGTFWGWTHNWFAGYPMGYHYPFFAYLLVITLKFLSAGTLSLITAYNAIVLLSYSVMSFAIFMLARKVHVPWWGLFFALLALVDRGGSDIGGFHWHLFAGVWPSGLAIAFGVLFALQFFAFCEAPSYRRASLSALLCAAALLSHPIQLVQFPIVLLVIACVFASTSKGISFFRTSAFCFFVLLTSLLSALWYLPYFATLEYATNEGTVWQSFPGLIEGVVQGNAVPGLWPFVHVLAFLGIVRGLFHQAPLQRCVSLIPLCLLVIATSSFMLTFQLDVYFPALTYIRYPRLIALAKPYLFVCAAMAASALFRDVAPMFRTFFTGRSFSQYVYSLVLVTTCVAFASSIIQELASDYTVHNREKIELKGRGAYKTPEVLQWLARHDSEKGQLSRLGIHESARTFDMLYDPQSSLQRMEYRMYETPATMFRYELRSDDNELARFLGIHYMLAKEPKVDSKHWQLEQHFGHYSLFSARHANAQWYTLRSQTAKAHRSSFSAEDIRVSIDTTKGDPGSLLVPVSNFSRWQASLDGRPVPIRTERFKTLRRSGFMVLPLAGGSGEYRLQFITAWQERIAPLCFLLGCVLACLPWAALGIVRVRRRTIV